MKKICNDLKKRYAVTLKNSLASKTLSLAALAGLILFGGGSASASDTESTLAQEHVINLSKEIQSQTAASINPKDISYISNSATYVAEPLQELPTVLRANGGLGEIAEPLQELPTVLRADGGLGEIAEPQHDKISSPDGKDKGGVSYIANGTSDAVIHNNLSLTTSTALRVMA